MSGVRVNKNFGMVWWYGMMVWYGFSYYTTIPYHRTIPCFTICRFAGLQKAYGKTWYGMIVRYDGIV